VGKQTFMGFMMPLDGYGYGTVKTAKALGRLAPWVDVLDMQTPKGTFGKVTDRGWWLEGRACALCVPPWLPKIDAADGLVSYTMFEATRLPEGWAEAINRHAERVIVPCEWNVAVFRESGVTRPIDVVRWGMDQCDYWLLPREHDGRPYTFLWSGTPDMRKGWDLAYRCFVRAFGEDPDVQLVLHFRSKLKGVEGFADPNVKMIVGMFERPALRAMLQRADCFVFPSRGEGWGAPPREAATTGLPVIATDWGGLHEEIEQWALPLRVAGMSKASYGPWEDIGDWAEPDPDHLIYLMRWCYENRAVAAARGHEAATWLREHASWERTALGVCEVLG
jgi:glycosyltransferase involved in cell wall biosynthesis